MERKYLKHFSSSELASGAENESESSEKGKSSTTLSSNKQQTAQNVPTEKTTPTSVK